MSQSPIPHKHCTSARGPRKFGVPQLPSVRWRCQGTPGRSTHCGPWGHLGAGVVAGTPRALGRTSLNPLQPLYQSHHPSTAHQHPVSPLTLYSPSAPQQPLLILQPPSDPQPSPVMTQRIQLPHHFTPHLLSHPEHCLPKERKGCGFGKGRGSTASLISFGCWTVFPVLAMVLMVQVPTRVIMKGLAVPKHSTGALTCPLLLTHLGWAGLSWLHEGILSQPPRLPSGLLV